MPRMRAFKRLLTLLVLGGTLVPAYGGDSIYGKVTAVRSGVVVVFDHGRGTYVVRLLGIAAPDSAAHAREAQQFVSNLVLNKSARIRFDHRAKNGEMISRLFTDQKNGDPTGIKDVGLELLKAGLATRQSGYDGKYGEWSAAENEARAARRGIWAQAQPR